MVQRKEVLEAQDRWGQSIVDIGREHSDRSKCKVIAEQRLNELYAFERGELLFKPTKAAEVPFRSDRKGALSYFIGGDDRFPEDSGFALQPWTAVRFENAGIILEDQRALAMGHYYFTDESGQETQVEYTFGYVKTDQGRLKIDLHHSSLPYSGT